MVLVENSSMVTNGLRPSPREILGFLFDSVEYATDSHCYIIAIIQPHHKIITQQPIAGVVDQRAFDQQGVWQENIFSVKGANVCIPEIKGPYGAFQIFYLDDVANAKWAAESKEKASQKIFPDVFKGKANHDGRYACPCQQTACHLLPSQVSEKENNAQHHHYQKNQSANEIDDEPVLDVGK